MSQAPIEGTGASKGNYKSYATGFFLAIALTLFSFALVVSGMLPRSVILIGICGAAIVQILVQLHYFLHLDNSSAARWNVLALLFTVVIMILFVGGTLWIMYNLDYRMR
jgi:cytochrome o ubiquinol oxidase operon protein cyoD